MNVRRICLPVSLLIECMGSTGLTPHTDHLVLNPIKVKHKGRLERQFFFYCVYKYLACFPY